MYGAGPRPPVAYQQAAEPVALTAVKSVSSAGTVRDASGRAVQVEVESCRAPIPVTAVPVTAKPVQAAPVPVKAAPVPVTAAPVPVTAVPVQVETTKPPVSAWTGVPAGGAAVPVAVEPTSGFAPGVLPAGAPPPPLNPSQVVLPPPSQVSYTVEKVSAPAPAAVSALAATTVVPAFASASPAGTAPVVQYTPAQAPVDQLQRTIEKIEVSIIPEAPSVASIVYAGNYAVGASIEIYSKTFDAWMKGKVTRIGDHGMVLTEFLAPDGRMKEKWIPHTHADLKMAPECGGSLSKEAMDATTIIPQKQVIPNAEWVGNAPEQGYSSYRKDASVVSKVEQDRLEALSTAMAQVQEQLQKERDSNKALMQANQNLTKVREQELVDRESTIKAAQEQAAQVAATAARAAAAEAQLQAMVQTNEDLTKAREKELAEREAAIRAAQEQATQVATAADLAVKAEGELQAAKSAEAWRAAQAAEETKKQLELENEQLKKRMQDIAEQMQYEQEAREGMESIADRVNSALARLQTYEVVDAAPANVESATLPPTPMDASCRMEATSVPYVQQMQRTGEVPVFFEPQTLPPMAPDATAAAAAAAATAATAAAAACNAMAQAHTADAEARRQFASQASVGLADATQVVSPLAASAAVPQAPARLPDATQMVTPALAATQVVTGYPAGADVPPAAPVLPPESMLSRQLKQEAALGTVPVFEYGGGPAHGLHTTELPQHKAVMVGPFSRRSASDQVSISEDAYTARRSHSCFQAVAMGASALERQAGGLYFEVRISGTMDGVEGGLGIGVTHTDPDKFTGNPGKASDVPLTVVVGLNGCVYLNGKESQIGWKPEKVQISQRIGLLITDDGRGDLIVFEDQKPVVHVDGYALRDAGMMAEPLYAIVELFGATSAVTMCPRAVLPPKPWDVPGTTRIEGVKPEPAGASALSETTVTRQVPFGAPTAISPMSISHRGPGM